MTTSIATSISITDIATISASVIAGIAFIVSSITYVQTTLRERRIKTLDYWETIQPSLLEARRTLSNIHSGEWSSEDARKHLNSPNVELITKGINAFERLATGVNLDIYDLKVLNKLAGKMIVDSYIAYAPIIVVREEQLGYRGSFREFEILYNNLEKLRKK
ncbi:hypothetical protein OPW41_24295 [Vibrio europaeus]|uniref:DUF4760 domain-containing protein n=1 Tax=Vibrio europaeus TaxID=300876 RepID=UPI00233EEC88|nr:hypothetical protein [Vibrio europaeus]MDC5757212.1 hypothetical protein [Vibrio europaeus]MDC5774295.1 hypothetical protein [Vibrio europaeus]MDC5797947.1 hypothetical protein [Vibrio europaeus]MDC5801179.1 hypothetical protein [Vibrio europaeus]MDC5814522.1 hypothetical protein [Vibrio europaeus]